MRVPDNLGMLPLYASRGCGPGAAPDPPSNFRQRRKLWKMNPKLTPEGRERRELDYARRQGARTTSESGRRASKGERGSGGGRGGGMRGGGGIRGYDGRDGGFRDRGGGRGNRFDERRRAREQVPSMPFLVRTLDRQSMLPAIIFIFSRAGCDEAAEAAAASANDRLLSPAEREEVERRVAAFRVANVGIPFDEKRLSLLSQGVAAHHAGMLPLEKGLVEGLFQDVLVKVRPPAHHAT